MANSDASNWRNGMIDTYGEDGAYIALAREVWFTAIRDADAIRRGTLPDSYHNDMTGGLKPPIKGGYKTGARLKQRATESLDEFLHSPDNAEDRRLWAEVGFDAEPDIVLRKTKLGEVGG
jgi:hypothetical protein